MFLREHLLSCSGSLNDNGPIGQEKADQPRGKEEGSGWKAHGVPNLTEYVCGVKPHSSEIGDNAVDLGIL